jgi:broad specificity phosphatase PhoE
VLTLLLTRHGHTTRSEPDQYLGQRVAAPLSERGRADAQRLAERLDGVPLERILTSPLERALETARILAAGRGIAVEPDDRLMERDYGAWEGMTIEQIQARFPSEFERYEHDPSTFDIGGAESGNEVAARLRAFFDDLHGWWQSAAAQDRTVVVVGHASLNRVMLAQLMGTPLRDYRRRWEADWASLSVLRWESVAEGPKLLLANDVAHLRGTRGATW